MDWPAGTSPGKVSREGYFERDAKSLWDDEKEDKNHSLRGGERWMLFGFSKAGGPGGGEGGVEHGVRAQYKGERPAQISGGTKNSAGLKWLGRGYRKARDG